MKHLFLILLFSALTFSQVNVRDSIAGNDTATYYYGGRYLYNTLTLTDTGSSLTDSVVVEFLNVSNNSWSSAFVGLYDAYSDVVLSSNSVVIPGAGVSRLYIINQPRVHAVRVRWVYGSDKSGRTHLITFGGQNE